MKQVIRKVIDKLRFKYSLSKKIALQKNGNGEDGYLNASELSLKKLLDKVEVEKNQSGKYFEQLSDELFDYLSKSGVSYRDICKIIAGKVMYTRSGFTPDQVQQTLVDAYCKTNGMFQEMMYDFLYRDHNQKLMVDGPSPIFGRVDEETVAKISQELRTTGYSKLPFTIPKSIVDEIANWSKQLEYTIIDDSLNGKFFKSKVDFSNCPYVKANANEDDLKNNELIMKICTDPLLLSILQTTLNSKVDLWQLSMWWSFKIEKPSSEAAQYFHYDLDTLRWLKIFVYLTDVGPKNGPHIAIPGSHKIGGKNYKLLMKRYDRISDEEMFKNQVGNVTEFSGPAGTIIIGDTRCWHKGKEVLEGNRLILQPTFSPTWFIKKLV